VAETFFSRGRSRRLRRSDCDNVEEIATMQRRCAYLTRDRHVCCSADCRWRDKGAHEWRRADFEALDQARLSSMRTCSRPCRVRTHVLRGLSDTVAMMTARPPLVAVCLHLVYVRTGRRTHQQQLRRQTSCEWWWIIIDVNYGAKARVEGAV
jgi:hypothetical protein